jgi:hypothetical protein
VYWVIGLPSPALGRLYVIASREKLVCGLHGHRRKTMCRMQFDVIRHSDYPVVISLEDLILEADGTFRRMGDPQVSSGQ